MPRRCRWPFRRASNTEMDAIMPSNGIFYPFLQLHKCSAAALTCSNNNKQFVTFSFFWPLGNYIISSKLNVTRRKGHIFLRFSKSTFSCDLQKVHRKINFIKDFCNCKKIKGFIFHNITFYVRCVVKASMMPCHLTSFDSHCRKFIFIFMQRLHRCSLQ